MTDAAMVKWIVREAKAAYDRADTSTLGTDAGIRAVVTPATDVDKCANAVPLRTFLPDEHWIAPGWLEALIPGRVRGYGTTEEVLV